MAGDRQRFGVEVQRRQAVGRAVGIGQVEQRLLDRDQLGQRPGSPGSCTARLRRSGGLPGNDQRQRRRRPRDQPGTNEARKPPLHSSRAASRPRTGLYDTAPGRPAVADEPAATGGRRRGCRTVGCGWALRFTTLKGVSVAEPLEPVRSWRPGHFVWPRRAHQAGAPRRHRHANRRCGAVVRGLIRYLVERGGYDPRRDVVEAHLRRRGRRAPAASGGRRRTSRADTRRPLIDSAEAVAGCLDWYRAGVAAHHAAVPAGLLAGRRGRPRRRHPGRRARSAWLARPPRRGGDAGRAGARLQRRRADELGLAADWRSGPAGRRGPRPGRALAGPGRADPSRASRRVSAQRRRAGPDPGRPGRRHRAARRGAAARAGRVGGELEVDVRVTRPGSLGHGAMLDAPDVWRRVLAAVGPSKPRRPAAVPTRIDDELARLKARLRAEGADQVSRDARSTRPTVALAVSATASATRCAARRSPARCCSSRRTRPGPHRRTGLAVPERRRGCPRRLAARRGCRPARRARARRRRDAPALGGVRPRLRAARRGRGATARRARRRPRCWVTFRRWPWRRPREPACPAWRSETSAGTGSMPRGRTSTRRSPGCARPTPRPTCCCVCRCTARRPTRSRPSGDRGRAAHRALRGARSARGTGGARPGARCAGGAAVVRRLHRPRAGSAGAGRMGTLRVRADAAACRPPTWLSCQPTCVALARNPADYVSLLAACDAVVTKPGYGIVADCLANRRCDAVHRSRSVPRVRRPGQRAADARPARATPPAKTSSPAGSARTSTRCWNLETPWTTQPMDGAAQVADRLGAILRGRS